MAITLGPSYIQFPGLNGVQKADNFGYIADAMSEDPYYYVKGVTYYNTSGRTQVFYMSFTGNASYPGVYCTDPSTYDWDTDYIYSWMWTGFAGSRQNLTYIVPAGTSHQVQNVGTNTLHFWTGNLFNE